MGGPAHYNNCNEFIFNNMIFANREIMLNEVCIIPLANMRIKCIRHDINDNSLSLCLESVSDPSLETRIQNRVDTARWKNHFIRAPSVQYVGLSIILPHETIVAPFH